MSNQQSKVFIVDDDRDLCAYLNAVLRSVGFSVKIYYSADTFLDEYQAGSAGCLLSDIMMPGTNGLALQQKLAEREICIPIIFMSAHGDISIAKTVLKRGAIDFIEKPINAMELLKSVEMALSKDEFFRRQKREIEIINARLACLTGREREVLDLLMAGDSNKMLAKKFSISLRTVETHRTNILKKMHVSTFTELVRKLLSASVPDENPFYSKF